MNPAAYDLMLFLESQGLGTFGTSLHVGVEPDEPDEVTTLYDLPGGAPDTDEMDVFHPTVRIRTRSAEYLDGYGRQELIRDLLINSIGFVSGTSRFAGATPLADVASLGRDDKNRHVFMVDYRCMRSAV